MATKQEIQLLNETLFEQLDNPGLQKQAVAVTETQELYAADEELLSAVGG